MWCDALRKLKRRLSALFLRMRVRREARRAFRYDLHLFLGQAGALHPERKEALRAEIVMDYHVLEKGLTMPRRRLGFGAEKVVHLVQNLDPSSLLSD